jgi:type IV pilus assembly protein PilV
MDSEANAVQRMARKAPARSRGFTMVEVLLAMVILSVSLLALAGLMMTTTKNTSFGNHMTEASTIAQDKIEELRSTLWASIPDGANQDQVRGSTGISYSRRWDVVTDGNLKTVSVTVNWMDQTNHFVRLLTAISH